MASNHCIHAAGGCCVCSGHPCTYAKKHFDVEAHKFEFVDLELGRDRRESFRIDEAEALLRKISEEIQKYFEKKEYES